jgi:hypothetical protein
MSFSSEFFLFLAYLLTIVNNVPYFEEFPPGRPIRSDSSFFKGCLQIQGEIRAWSISKVKARKTKKGPRGQRECPWSLHIGSFWKIRFTTSSGRLNVGGGDRRPLAVCRKTLIRRHSRESGSPECLEKTGFPLSWERRTKPEKEFFSNLLGTPAAQVLPGPQIEPAIFGPIFRPVAVPRFQESALPSAVEPMVTSSFEKKCYYRAMEKNINLQSVIDKNSFLRS